MFFIGNLLLIVLRVYSWVVIASVVVSWLIAFDVINTKNVQAQNLLRLLDRATEPVYRPLRKYIPPIGGVDITPIVVLFGIWLLQQLVIRLFMLPGYYGMF